MADDTLPLEIELRRRIGLAGPMPLASYVEACLCHPQHGYYMTRNPIGADGDFITAPEISQMFGELLGLWAAAVWRQMGSPDNVRLVELGPGRGTMLRDALRAAKVVPQFRAAVVAHLVEVSPALQKLQRETLAGSDVPMLWHDTLTAVPEGPAIVLANEFFDALPVQQAVKQEDGWHERTVMIDGVGNFALGLTAGPLRNFDKLLPPHVRDAPLGSIFEWRTDSLALELGRRMARSGGAALIMDYGHSKSDVGDTLQAVGEHAHADPLVAPGVVDLTAHVDFQALGQAAESMGARVHGPVEQGEFLRRLGIDSRADALKAHASPEKAHAIDGALERLTGSGARKMGVLFKAMAIADPKLGDLPGFET